MLRLGRVGPYIQMVQLMSWRHGVFFSQWNSSISCHAIKTHQKNISVIFWLVEIDQSGSRLTNQWDYFVSKCSNVIGSAWGILIGCWVGVGLAVLVKRGFKSAGIKQLAFTTNTRPLTKCMFDGCAEIRFCIISACKWHIFFKAH